ncbi:HupE/UreJ family protein, partial [bacterium]|nr:HupE/UreJ family protein [bacterium]
LMGTYVEIMLQINMLDGRAYSTTLKPSRSSFIIPEPVSSISLILKSSYFGMRHILIQPEVYLLLFVLVFFITQRRILLVGFVAYVLSHLLSQYMAQEQLLKISPYLASFAVLFFVLFPAFDLVQGKPALRRWFRPFWILAIILGFLSGGARTDTLSLPGLSYNEQYFVTIGFNIGIAIGLFLGYYLIKEFNQLLTMFILRTRPQKAHIVLGYLIGVSASALLFYQSTTLLVVPSIFPELSLEFFIFPLLFGFWFWQADFPKFSQVGLIFISMLGLGLIVGGNGYMIPMGSLLLITSVLIFSTQLLFSWKFPPSTNLVIAIIAVFSYGWTASQVIFENLTLPTANTIGFAGLATCFFLIGYNFFSEEQKNSIPPILKILAGGSSLSIILIRINEYIILFNRDIATNLALGQLTIPVLSLILLIGTLIAWPRKRKIHQHLEIESKRPIKHWIIISLSFLLIPFGHIGLNNPFYQSHAPQGTEAKLVLQQILSNTYHAFNLENEDELYQKLAASVSGDLVANIYLDSRRRLTAGVRKGAEVAVRDVSVVSVGELIEGTNPMEGFSYESKWTVTARVKHLQHIHYRKNIYSGFLKIKVEDNQWKIVEIDLKSEDRVIVQGSSG